LFTGLLKQSGPIPAGCHFLLPPLFVLPIFSSTKNPATRISAAYCHECFDLLLCWCVFIVQQPDCQGLLTTAKLLFDLLGHLRPPLNSHFVVSGWPFFVGCRVKAVKIKQATIGLIKIFYSGAAQFIVRVCHKVALEMIQEGFMIGI
jgi:hypothetical protein